MPLQGWPWEDDRLDDWNSRREPDERIPVHKPPSAPPKVTK